MEMLAWLDLLESTPALVAWLAEKRENARAILAFLNCGQLESISRGPKLLTASTLWD